MNVQQQEKHIKKIQAQHAREQKRLVKEIAAHAVAEVIEKIDAGKIPAEWNGVELRWYLMSHIDWDRIGDMRLVEMRKKEYDNTVMVNGL